MTVGSSNVRCAEVWYIKYFFVFLIVNNYIYITSYQNEKKKPIWTKYADEYVHRIKRIYYYYFMWFEIIKLMSQNQCPVKPMILQFRSIFIF